MKEGYCRMTISSRKMSFQRMGFWGYYNHTIPLFSNKPSRPAPKFNVSNLAKVAVQLCHPHLRAEFPLGPGGLEINSGLLRWSPLELTVHPG